MYVYICIAYTVRKSNSSRSKISLALWNGGAQNVDFRSANWQKLAFFVPQFLGSTYEHFDKA